MGRAAGLSLMKARYSSPDSTAALTREELILPAACARPKKPDLFR